MGLWIIINPHLLNYSTVIECFICWKRILACGGEDTQKAFQVFGKRFSVPLLTHCNSSKTNSVDASHNNIGTVMAHSIDNQSEKPSLLPFKNVVVCREKWCPHWKRTDDFAVRTFITDVPIFFHSE